MSANSAGWPMNPPWSPGNSTGVLPSRSPAPSTPVGAGGPSPHRCRRPPRPSPSTSADTASSKAARGRRTWRPPPAPFRTAPALGVPGRLQHRLVEPGLDHELEPGRPHALGVERRDVSSVSARCCSASGSTSRLRGSCRPCLHAPSGMLGDQRQPGHRAAAGSEDISGLGAHRIQQRGHIVGAQLRGGILLGSSIELAAIPRGS